MPRPTLSIPPKVGPGATPLTSFGDGAYLVGRDIAPGSYGAPGVSQWGDGGPYCKWVILVPPGEEGAMSFGDTPGGFVVIEPGSYGFRSKDCGTWVRDR